MELSPYHINNRQYKLKQRLTKVLRIGYNDE